MVELESLRIDRKNACFGNFSPKAACACNSIPTIMKHTYNPSACSLKGIISDSLSGAKGYCKGCEAFWSSLLISARNP